MKIAKRLLSFVFLISLSVSAFGSWSTQHTVSLKQLYAIDGVTTASLARLCAVGDGNYVVLSTDYGTTWTAPAGDVTGNFRGVAIGANYLYVAGDTAALGGVCYYSSNWGTSWTDRSPSALSACTDVDFGNSTDGVIVGEKSGPPAGPCVLYTTNGGSTWTDSTPATLPSVNAVHFVSDSVVWIVGGSGHVWKSTDGGQNWTRKGDGVADATLQDVHFSDASHGFIVGTSNSFLYTTDGGETWTLNTSALSSSSDNFGVHAADANTVWVVGGATGDTNNSIISKLTYSGSAWSAASEYTGSNERFMKVFLTNADNGWVAGYSPVVGDVSPIGEILGQITDIAVSSIVQKLKPTQTTVYPGFSGDLKVTVNNAQLGPWPTSSFVTSGSVVTTSNISYVSATELTATINVDASAATGDRTVTVTNTDSRADTHTLTIFPLPIVTSVQPSSLVQGATDQSVILHSAGGGFQSGLTTTDISFGAGITVKSVVVDSAFQMTVVLDVALSAATGTRDITINLPNGASYTSTAVFVVSSATATNPILTSAYPDMERNSTEILTILGSDIKTGATVSFSTAGISVNSYDYSRIATENRLDVNITVSSSAALGATTVTVLNTDGGVGNLNQAFYVKDVGTVDPRIISVLPTPTYQGKQNEHLSIGGTGFQSGAQISIVPSDGITISSVDIVDSTLIRIVINVDSDAAVGMRRVLLVNPDGGNAFTDKIDVKAAGDPLNPQVVPDSGRAGPNPWDPASGDPVHIQFELDAPALVTIPVMDCNGRKLWEFQINGVAGHNDFTWDGKIFSSHVSNGIVLMPLIINGKVEGKIKLMVVNQ